MTRRESCVLVASRRCSSCAAARWTVTRPPAWLSWVRTHSNSALVRSSSRATASLA